MGHLSFTVLTKQLNELNLMLHYYVIYFIIYVILSNAILGKILEFSVCVYICRTLDIFM